MKKLEQELVELREDRARKDWLVQHSAYVSHSRDGEVCSVWFSHDPDDETNGSVPAEGYPQKCYYTANDAIDAARRRTT